MYHDWENFCIEPLRPQLGENLTLRIRTSDRSGFLILERFGELEHLTMKSMEGGLEIEVKAHVANMRYCFFLVDSKIYWSSNGANAVLPRYDHFFQLITLNAPPDWAIGAVFYQIFPDRFRNANPQLHSQQKPWNYEGKQSVLKDWGQPVENRDGALQNFGGDLGGITESISYLEDLGVEALYLTPIFPSPSSHRYDSSDYLNICERLGGNQSFRLLTKKLKERKIRLVLDGVLNHIGNRHPLFLKAQSEPTSSAAKHFTFYPDGRYAAFFGVKTLPKLDYKNSETLEHWITGPKSPVRHWIREGIDGWRLDVAHQIGEDGTDDKNIELLRTINQTAKQENPETFVFGELSFDTTEKLKLGTLDASMHYAGFCHPVLEWLSGKNIFGWDVSVSAEDTWNALWDHYASLPVQTRQCMYTLLSSHDIPRALWRLRGSAEKYLTALGLLMVFPGSPGLYYGEEIGLNQTNSYDVHAGDPMCRGTFPWNLETWNLEILESAKQLIKLKKNHPAIRRGGMLPYRTGKNFFSFLRVFDQQYVLAIFSSEPIHLEVPECSSLLTSTAFSGEIGVDGFEILELKKPFSGL